jgi:Zn-dependent protease with chaperone function
MDFYSRQAQARSQTRWLVIGFIVAITLVVIALDLVLFTAFGFATPGSTSLAPWQFIERKPGAALFCTLVVLAVIGLSSLFKAAQLRGGGGVVAHSLGGVRVGRDTSDIKRKRLHNVVEEMAIASGVPMPEIYVLENETGINAFAAGHTPANAAIAVTQGALDNLSRDELQGIIGHEFSHVLNGDMRLNLQLMGWLFGLFVVALVGRTLLRYAPRGRRGAGWLIAAAAAVMVLGYVGMFFARLLQAAVSRQRERLADASSVQFTRNPDGLKGALLKVAGLSEGSKIVHADAEQAAHMLFAPGASRLLRTHPTLAERIKELDPHFDVKRLPEAAASSLKLIPAFDASELAGASVFRAVDSSGAAQPVDTVQPNAIGAAVRLPAVAAQVGQVETLHIKQAQQLRLALPESLREFVESSGRARALVLALLVSRDAAVREKQFALLAKSTSASELAVVRDTLPAAESLEPMLRLPALLQIFPALRRLPIAERRSLAKLADNLIRADARVDVFEFCLAHLLATLIRDELEARAPHGNLSLADGDADIQVLFATLATFGSPDARKARMSYEAGMQVVMPMHRPPYLAIEDWPRRLSDSLKRLEKLQPFAKKAVIEGLVKTIAHDEVLSIEEAELLRTVCAALHCPLPPLLPGLIGGRA